HFECFGVFGLAFPDDKDFPAEFLELPNILLVPLHVLGEFLSPEVRVVLGHGKRAADSVLMPEASVDQDDLLVADENGAGVPWEPLVVQAVTDPHAMYRTGHAHFRLRVFVLDS